jgi:hypothetical protein
MCLTLVLVMALTLIPGIVLEVRAKNHPGKFIAEIGAIAEGSIPISNRAELETISNNLSGSYHLTADIDLSGKEWIPIGTHSEPFIGIFDGQGHVLKNFTMSTKTDFYARQGDSMSDLRLLVGLFGYADKAVIKNVGMEEIQINISLKITDMGLDVINHDGGVRAGAICGVVNGIIDNCYATGSISIATDSAPVDHVGGLLGSTIKSSNLTNCYNAADITYSGRCSVSFGVVGGIAGAGGSFSRCFNTGNIQAGRDIASSDVYVGGIVGINGSNVAMSNCYNSGNLHGTARRSTVGGLCGSGSDSFINCYSTGDVMSAYSNPNNNYVAPIVAFCSQDYTYFENCYWNNECVQAKAGVPQEPKYGANVIVGHKMTAWELLPLSAEEMKKESSFTGFDFENVWTFKDGVNNGYPVLQFAVGDNPDHDETDNSIDYSPGDLIVPGRASDTALYPEGTFFINLTLETITIPEEYSVVTYSVDGGEKWKKAKGDTFTDAKFLKMFSKDMTLALANTAIDKKTKKPGKDTDGNDAVIIKFSLISKRPKLPKLVVNYLVGADKTGNTAGDWVLSEKGENKAVKKGIEVGVAAGKTVDENGYGVFYLDKGIHVTAAKTVYYIRTAPTKKDGIYIAASKSKKITVAAVLKAPKYKVKAKSEKKDKNGAVKTPASAVISVKANTYVSINGDAPRLYSAKTILNVLNITGVIELWTAATAKKPASFKQTIER